VIALEPEFTGADHEIVAVPETDVATTLVGAPGATPEAGARYNKRLGEPMVSVIFPWVAVAMIWLVT
jgi:hypothetical protein